MTLDQYEDLTGLTVATADIGKYHGLLQKTQSILENQLGFTLDTSLVNINEYSETGRTAIECPCGDIDESALLDADAVVTAYRLFNYNPNDKFFIIDPASEIHAVKLVRGSITVKTLETYEYRPHKRNGFIKALEQPTCWCSCNCDCSDVQLAVDANWLWDANDTMPKDLLYVWSDMVTHYADAGRDIKSQTLGTHSYTRFDQIPPEKEAEAAKIVSKYAGSNGTANRSIVI